LLKSNGFYECSFYANPGKASFSRVPYFALSFTRIEHKEDELARDARKTLHQ